MAFFPLLLYYQHSHGQNEILHFCVGFLNVVMLQNSNNSG